MKHIRSRDNPQFKSLKKLIASASTLRKQGQAFLDGVHLCEAWLQSGRELLTCLLGESALNHPEVHALLDAVPDNRRVLLEDDLFASISPLENGIGIAFLVELPVVQKPVAINQNCVLLDRIQDPGNLGSILRSAAAAGVKQIYCSVQTVYAWSPKVLRAGMGAHFHLEIFEDCDLKVVLQKTVLPVLAASPHATQSIYQRDLSKPAAWVFGNEGSGVSPDLHNRVEWLAIPQPGGLESLNVSAAAAICLFEQVRQGLGNKANA